ncbi:50S ribosomal protein L18 [Nannocystis pusilla]|uniref:Large ribosomal subunit protein uL18 n=1 Tax=Nannocystis pusilla TaxID=889268 RepID=A0A9X3J2U7_9BACT|nr:50S ribosomal protein L18 [Nannocystis pusilla]MCY1012149.1 50S ribosomal protein L18 [Nannocystis pusilla]
MPSPKEQIRLRRKASIRKRVHGTTERPRLSVFRSAKHIYAQVIDDSTSATLVASSSLIKELAAESEKTKRELAELVGTAIAKACLAKGITKVVFDRNGYIYHGRVKALADGARAGGLDF